MNEWVWHKDLISDSSFYDAFTEFGYQLCNQEEIFHNFQTKKEISNLIVGLFEFEEDDIILDPACGTGRIFENIISKQIHIFT